MSDFNSTHNRVVWLDVPVQSLARAEAFYRAVLGVPVTREKFDTVEFSLVHHEQGNGGCLIVDPDAVSERGMLVYFNVDGRIRDAVKQVARLGGRVTQDVHAIGPHGFRVLAIDSEGNRLALHSMMDR